MEQSCDNWSTASESRSTCRNRSRARLRRSAFWVSLARGICHKHTTVYDINQCVPDFRQNSSRRSNSKLSFAFGESPLHLGESRSDDLSHLSTDVSRFHLAPRLEP